MPSLPAGRLMPPCNTNHLVGAGESMKFLTHKCLSESDLKLLAGTALIERMLGNRIIIKINNEDDNELTEFRKLFADEQMICDEIQDLYFFRNLSKKHSKQSIFEFLFADPKDMDKVLQNLTQLQLQL